MANLATTSARGRRRDLVRERPDLVQVVREHSTAPWEIALKHRLRRLMLSEPPAEFVPAQRKLHGVDPLPVDEEAALHLAKLPRLHRDPFDRMLVCQAVTGGMTLLTPDPEIHRYAVRALW